MGARGEGWVVVQMVIVGAIFFAPRSATWPGWLRALGGLCLLLAAVLGVAAMLALGRNLTPFPKPRDESELVRDGLYRLVRHPIYLSVILGALGWALWRGSLVGTALVVVLFAFFDAKSRHEERWLVERYPDYVAYQREVKRLVPWVY